MVRGLESLADADKVGAPVRRPETGAEAPAAPDTAKGPEQPVPGLRRSPLPALGARPLLHRAPPGPAAQPQQLLPIHASGAQWCGREGSLGLLGPLVGPGLDQGRIGWRGLQALVLP